MQPRIENIGKKKLIGKHLKMSVADNRTSELWSGFMPKLKDIKNRVSAEMISMQVYEVAYFKNFSPNHEFEKWATVEVSDFNDCPNDLKTFLLTGGLYAVFDYKGSGADARIFHYIFSIWLPSSKYDLDIRPHFEVLGEKYSSFHLLTKGES